MSHIIVISADMHKIADINVDVRFCGERSVVKYVPIEFEIFKEGKYFKAIPLQDLQTCVQINLPYELLFQVKEGKIYNYGPGTKEVVQDIVSELEKRNLVDTPQKAFVERTNTPSRTMLFV